MNITTFNDEQNQYDIVKYKRLLHTKKIIINTIRETIYADGNQQQPLQASHIHLITYRWRLIKTELPSWCWLVIFVVWFGFPHLLLFISETVWTLRFWVRMINPTLGRCARLQSYLTRIVNFSTEGWLAGSLRALELPQPLEKKMTVTK